MLQAMRILEALEGKGFRLPLVKGEAELAEKLGAITRQVAIPPVPCDSSFRYLYIYTSNMDGDETCILVQLKGSGPELSRRVQNLLAVSQAQANGFGGASMYLPGSTKIHEQSLADLQQVKPFYPLLNEQFQSLSSLQILLS